MIDYAKRKTLKIIGTVGTAAAAMSAATGGLAKAVTGPNDPTVASAERPLADISVSTRVSTTTNDLEIVLTNSGTDITTITQVTPLEMRVNRGKFDFARLLKTGGLKLHPGQSVSVALEPVTVRAGGRVTHGGVLGDGPTFVIPSMADTPTLTDALRKSMSVVTEGDAWAKLTVMDQSRWA